MPKKTTEKKSQVKELKEKLLSSPKNSIQILSESAVKKCDKFCEGYKEFLDNAKTEREATIEAVKLAKAYGFTEYDPKKKLNAGDKIYYAWNPDRECLVEYLGDNVFKVLESKNSKVQKNDTFVTAFFVENQPLYLDDLTRDGETYALFVVGKNGGLQVVEKR